MNTKINDLLNSSISIEHISLFTGIDKHILNDLKLDLISLDELSGADIKSLSNYAQIHKLPNRLELESIILEKEELIQAKEYYDLDVFETSEINERLRIINNILLKSLNSPPK